MGGVMGHWAYLQSVKLHIPSPGQIGLCWNEREFKFKVETFDCNTQVGLMFMLPDGTRHAVRAEYNPDFPGDSAPELKSKMIEWVEQHYAKAA